MIRGAIDFFDGERVGGWVHSDVADVRERTVLAFVDGECVGGGRIEVFRQDLADAGLGDGVLGFSFGVTLPEDVAPGRTIVKLEGSDFVLLQSRSDVVDRETGKAGVRPARIDLTVESVSWMSQQGWLDEYQADCLGRIVSIGMYESSLRTSQLDFADPAVEAKGILELYHQRPLEIASREVPLADLAGISAELAADGVYGPIAFHTEGCVMQFVEGSHTDDAPTADFAGAIRHLLRPERLIVIDPLSTFACTGDQTARIFLPAS